MQTVPSEFAIVFPEVLAVEYGYIRVSSKEQNVGRQLGALYSMGLHAKQIYIDKQSGKMHEVKAFCFEVRETVCETRYIVSKELILEKSDGFLLKIMSTCVII